MIKILFVLNGTINLGGTEKVVENIFDVLNKEIFHIDFMLHCKKEQQENNEFFRKIKNSDSKIFYVTPRYESFYKNKRDIYLVLQENNFDIIHTHMDAAGAIILYYARKNGYKIRIAHSHNTEHQNLYNGMKKVIYNIMEDTMRYWIRKEATCCIACSLEASYWLFGKKLTVNRKTDILLNSIDARYYQFDIGERNRIRNQLNLQDKFVVGSIGRICEQKNTKFMIEIMRELVEINSTAILLHIGPGDVTELNQLAEEYGIKENVLFYGKTENAKEMLDAMDVFLFPSLWEGLSIACLEAQANGLPIIFSSSIPKECRVTNYKIIDLKKGASEWAEEIMNIKSVQERDKVWEIFIGSNYDKFEYKKRLEKIYICLTGLNVMNIYKRKSRKKTKHFQGL